VLRSFRTQFTKYQFRAHFWTDGLNWILGNKKLKPFVQHCIYKIQQFTLKLSATWHYWLTNDKNWLHWTPSSTFHLHVVAITSEEFVPSVPRPLPEQTICLHKIIDLNNYSSLGKLLRISAYILRFVTNIKKCNDRQLNQFTATEIDFVRLRAPNAKYTRVNCLTLDPTPPVTNGLH